MIPHTEITAFIAAVADAFAAASRGRVTEGEALLIQGEDRARAASESGHEWAAELMEHYLCARAHFAEQHSAPPDADVTRLQP